MALGALAPSPGAEAVGGFLLLQDTAGVSEGLGEPQSPSSLSDQKSNKMQVSGWVPLARAGFHPADMPTATW